MIALAAAALVVVAIALPHALALERAPAGFASAIWLCALLLRALCALAVAVAAEVYGPMLGALGSWCAGAMGNHALADAVFAIPALICAASLAGAVLALRRSARSVRALLRESVVGPGPGDSLIVADGALLVGVAGLRRPRVVVSAGALLALDDEELRAGLEHERGHIALHHRYLRVAGELARAFARYSPGTTAAARELTFSLERHADAYAVARRHDPAVLASAICKTAAGQFAAPPAFALGGGVVTRRARLLLDGQTRAPRPPAGLVALAPAMVALVAASAIALPFAAHAGYHATHQRVMQDCALR